MFRVMYDHARNSVTEFYCWSGYLLEQPSTWSEVKSGLHYFRDEAMVDLLQKMEGLFEARNQAAILPPQEVSYKDLEEDPDLFNSISLLCSIPNSRRLLLRQSIT